MPLSEQQWVKTLKVVGAPRDSAADASSSPAGVLPAAGPDDELDAGPSACPGRPASAESPTRAALLTSDAPVAHNSDSLTADAPVAHGSGPMGPSPSGVSTSDPNATVVADPVSWYRHHPPQRSRPVGRPSDSIQGHRLQDSDAMDAAWRYVSPEEEDEALARADLAAARKAASARVRSNALTADSRGQPLAPTTPRTGELCRRK
jgi:hypothetical protein